MGRRTRLVDVPTKPTKAECLSLRPHPLVWSRALVLAEGDFSRLCVTSPTTVLVLNHPKGRQ